MGWEADREELGPLADVYGGILKDKKGEGLVTCESAPRGRR